MRSFNSLTFLISFTFLLYSCGQSKIVKIVGTEKASDIILNQPDEVIVEVFYEEETPPYTGLILGDIKTWDILADNLQKIYEDKPAGKRIFVPTEISEMKKIPSSGKKSWTGKELYELAQKYSPQDTNIRSMKYPIFFVSGYFNDGAIEARNTIGVNISNTRVIAIFKDVIERTEGEKVKKFMEQSTLVHEVGHVIGLVNKGIPLASSHQDKSNGAHCNNPHCVMYWLNEGASDLEDFVKKFISTRSTILFGPHCLEDIRNF